LKKIEEGGKIILNRSSVNQYVHTTGEIIQRIELLDGGKMPPKTLLKYIFEESSLKKEQKFPIKESDIIVIEVSSIKQIAFGNYFLQLNRLIDETRPVLGGEAEFDLWMGKLRRKIKDGQVVESGNKRISKNPEKILTQIDTKLLDELDLERAVRKIIDFLEVEILLVNHINITKKGGGVLQSRQRLCQMMDSISHRLGVELFDPTPLVKGNKRNKMLKKKGEDINHYSELGEERTGKEIYKRISEIIGRKLKRG
jgi:hypothetical protein